MPFAGILNLSAQPEKLVLWNLQAARNQLPSCLHMVFSITWLHVYVSEVKWEATKINIVHTYSQLLIDFD